jgi:hypothetical protein
VMGVGAMLDGEVLVRGCDEDEDGDDVGAE